MIKTTISSQGQDARVLPTKGDFLKGNITGSLYVVLHKDKFDAGYKYVLWLCAEDRALIVPEHEIPQYYTPVSHACVTITFSN